MLREVYSTFVSDRVVYTYNATGHDIVALQLGANILQVGDGYWSDALTSDLYTFTTLMGNDSSLNVEVSFDGGINNKGNSLQRGYPAIDRSSA